MCEQTSATPAQGRDIYRALSLREVDECSRLLDKLDWLASVANLAATDWRAATFAERVQTLGVRAGSSQAGQDRAA